MGKDLASDLQLLAEGVFQQECTKWEVAVLGLRNDCLTAAAVQEPNPQILLQPDRNFLPNLTYAESLLVVAGRHFEHRKSADLGNVPRFFDEGDFCTELHVRVAESARAHAARSVDRVVGWIDRTLRRDDVQLHPRNGAPS